MNCAKCDQTLTPITVRKIEVDRCEGCAGIWFDRHELDGILESGESHLLDAEGGHPSELDKHPGTCPRCTVALTRYDSHMIDALGYDHCSTCNGVWLDKGELATLASNPEAGAVVAFAADIAHSAFTRGHKTS